jgi:uncharacterized membrane protein
MKRDSMKKMLGYFILILYCSFLFAMTVHIDGIKLALMFWFILIGIIMILYHGIKWIIN